MPLPSPNPMPPHRQPSGGAPPQPPKPDPKLLSIILKPIIMTLITSLFFLLLGLASFILLPVLLILSAASLRRRGQFPSSPDGFSPDDLNKLSRFKYSKETVKIEGETDCVVCLESFKGGQWCRRLVGCGHLFHRRCVDTWLVKVAACPTCRTRVRLNTGPRNLVLGFEENKRFWAFNRSGANFRVR